jgi:HEAT repeat protein
MLPFLFSSRAMRMKQRIWLLLGLIAVSAWAGAYWLLTNSPRDDAGRAKAEDERLWRAIPEATDTQRRIKGCAERLLGADERDRRKAAQELEALGAAAAPAIPVLVRSLKSKFPLTIYWGGIFTEWDRVPPAARDALSAVGPDAVAPLTTALEDSDPLTRVLAASALWRINKNPDPVGPVLFSALHDKEAHQRDNRVRLEAEAALSDIGRVDLDAVLSRLVREFESPDEDLYQPVEEALFLEIGDDISSVFEGSSGVKMGSSTG